KGSTAKHFGQDYPSDVTELLGVLMIRVNLIEGVLIDLLAAVAEMKRERAEVLFFSTVNMKARLDMIRGLLKKSELSDPTMGNVTKGLDRVKAANDQRNELVHGHWKFHTDKFEVVITQPGNVDVQKTLIVTAKSVGILISAYRLAGAFLEGCIHTIRLERTIAVKTEDNASSGAPKS
ncbi:hypothetical protein, partial [Asticcacaulis benevestitus]|uniref:hypothetical protein n=1 Tax=Asticcacaulis benevestitus TaxID=347481 RepID=UPI0005587D6C